MTRKEAEGRGREGRGKGREEPYRHFFPPLRALNKTTRAIIYVVLLRVDV